MGWSYVEEPCCRCLLLLLDLCGSSGGTSFLSILSTAERSCRCSAVLNSAEERRCYSDEQDHDHYLYLRRTRHACNLYPNSARTSAVVSFNGRRSEPKSDRTRPPCVFNTLAAPSSVFRCQVTPPLRASVVPSVPGLAPQSQKSKPL